LDPEQQRRRKKGFTTLSPGLYPVSDPATDGTLRPRPFSLITDGARLPCVDPVNDGGLMIGEFRACGEGR
jgi:hypothetical protein